MESKPKKSWIVKQLEKINKREKELGISKLTTLDDLKNEGKNENWENRTIILGFYHFEESKINWLLNKKDKYLLNKIMVDHCDQPVEIWKEYPNSIAIKVKICYCCKDDINGEELIFYPKKWANQQNNIINLEKELKN